MAAKPASWQRDDSLSTSSASPPNASGGRATSSGPQRKNSNTTPPGKAGKKTARKKVAKACLACQKSHLTCDECRPCTRCMKKGIGDQCVEGVRKKAKYLMEGDERARAAAAPAAPAPQAPPPAPASFHSNSPPNIAGFPSIPVSLLPNVTVAPQVEPVRVPDNIWLTAPLPEVQTAPQALDWGTQNNDPFNFTASAAANLEYEMFDSMFGSLSPSFPLGDLGAGNSTDGSTPNMWSSFGLPEPANSGNNAQNDALIGTQDMPMIGHDLSPTHMFGGQWQTTDDSFDIKPKKLTPEDVYRTILKPHDYTEGYHILMQYLTQNFEKQDILRVVRALAAFRPSLIALQMTMSEDDEVFLERSFQRTLIELEKLISYSATPTAVWRRTGELVCVAPQFCQLIGKTEEQLIASRMCIYQLFSKNATIEYWENFAEHAFENTTQNFFQATSLETDKGSLPCAACFTIRRDVFDLPSVIIGQFLPIPPEAMQ